MIMMIDLLDLPSLIIFKGDGESFCGISRVMLESGD